MTTDNNFEAVKALRRKYQAYLIERLGFQDALTTADAVQAITKSWEPESCWALNL